MPNVKKRKPCIHSAVKRTAKKLLGKLDFVVVRAVDIERKADPQVIFCGNVHSVKKGNFKKMMDMAEASESVTFKEGGITFSVAIKSKVSKGVFAAHIYAFMNA